MILPRDYDSAQAYDGTKSQTLLTPGGHICRIRDAKVDTAKSGKQMLLVAYDIAEGSEFDGYYANRFNVAKQYRNDATWPGVFRVTILNNQGMTNGYFKGLIQSVEESNPGYNFHAAGNNETTLRGKIVGFVFGEEEYIGYNSTIRTSVKPLYAVNVQKVKDGIEPPQKKFLPKEEHSTSNQEGASSGTEDNFDDELPF